MTQPITITGPVTVTFQPEELFAIARAVEELPFKTAKPLLDKLVAAVQAPAHEAANQEAA